MMFPRPVIITLVDADNAPGTVVDYAITRAKDGGPHTSIGATKTLTYTDQVDGPGTYVYGGTPRNPNETTSELLASPLVLLQALRPLTSITVVIG